MTEYGFNDFGRGQDVSAMAKGVDVDSIVRGIQPICFENAMWAYDAGRGHRDEEGRAPPPPKPPKRIGEGLQAFCMPGSVADQRKVGLGHGNLGAMLLR